MIGGMMSARVFLGHFGRGPGVVSWEGDHVVLFTCPGS